MSTPKPTRVSIRLHIAMACAATLLAAHVSASAGTYLGGAWNNPSSWSDHAVPNAFTWVDFTGSHTGVVQLNGGGVADRIAFSPDSDGYRIAGEAGATLTVRAIDGGGGSPHPLGNAIEVAILRGVKTDPEHGILDIHSGSNYIGSLNRLNISSIVSDAHDGTFAATDVYANATFSNAIATTGSTTLFGTARLIGPLGRITVSGEVNVRGGAVLFDNSAGRAMHRLPAAATMRLDNGEMVFLGDDLPGEIEEQVTDLVVGAGLNSVSVLDNVRFQLGNGLSGLTRDASAGGTLRVNGYNLRLAPLNAVDGVLPYATINEGVGPLAPVMYDDGPDGIRDSEDDPGLVPVVFESLGDALGNGTHALVTGPENMSFGDNIVQTLTLSGGSLNLGALPLTVASGVIVVNDGPPGGAPVLSGAAQLTPGPGGGIFLYNYNTDVVRLDGHLGGGGGLTITNYDTFDGIPFGTGEVVLNNSNSYAGQTTVNHGRLVIRNAFAVPGGSTIRLNRADIAFDYAGGTVPNRIILDGNDVAPGIAPRNDFIRQIALQDNRTFTFSGMIEGHGHYFLTGQNTTMIITTPLDATASAASDGEFVF